MLVVTSLDDTTADSVIEHLPAAVKVARLDVADFPESVEFHVFADGSGQLATPTRTVELDQVRAVYWRRPTPVRSGHPDAEVAAFAEREARAGFVAAIKALPCLHVNHPDRVRIVDNKPSQLRTAVQLGLPVPATTITNRPDHARRFAEQHGRVVYKPLRPPEITRNGQPMAIWAGEVDPGTITDQVTATAHTFQARVEKTADVRLTAIGTDLFAVRIDSGLLDWRSDYDRLSYSPVPVPDDIADAVHRYLDRFGPSYGCFDFAWGVDDRWWFMECKPAGQWAWLEDETGLPMSATFAHLLAQGDT